MADKDRIETEMLIRCDNEQCRELSTESELKQNKGKCPYCGKRVLKL